MREELKVNIGRAMNTLQMLSENKGLSYDEIAGMLHKSIGTARNRIAEARKFVESPENAGFGFAIPRPTRENNWKFCLTDNYLPVPGEPDGPSIVQGDIDDRKALIVMNSRLAHGALTAYSKLNSSQKKSSYGQKIKSRSMGFATAAQQAKEDLVGLQELLALATAS